MDDMEITEEEEKKLGGYQTNIHTFRGTLPNTELTICLTSRLCLVSRCIILGRYIACMITYSMLNFYETPRVPVSKRTTVLTRQATVGTLLLVDICARF